MVWSRDSRTGGSPAPPRADRAERLVKAVAVGAALLAVPIAVALGQMKYEAAMQASAEHAASSYEATAVLQEDAGAYGGYLMPQVPVLATWRAADGSAHEGDVLVEPELTAGSEVTVWLDEEGQPTAAPATRGENIVSGVLAGLQKLVLMQLAILAGYWLVLRLMQLARHASLEAEWSQIEPKWSRRTD